MIAYSRQSRSAPFAFGLLSAWLLALVLLALPVAARADAGVQTTWRLLDYVAVDYREAVAGGKVVNEFEYREMTEFSNSVAERIGSLPANPARAQLRQAAGELQKAIRAKAAPEDVARRARALAGALLAAHPVPLAPASAPDMKTAGALYASNCGACHGPAGEGGQGAFAKLDPPPIAFADAERARERSVFGLYQVISQGLEGTSMQSFAQLPDEQRWALAFYAGRLAFPKAAEGERIWRSDASVRAAIPDMTTLASITPAVLGARIGAERADAVIAYLRANPGAVLASATPGSLEVARGKLRQSLARYEAGDRSAAEELALSAYLDGFEPVEAVLATRDGGLMTRVEAAMAGFRTAIGRGVPPAELRRTLAETETLLGEAETVLAPEAATDLSTFLGAFAILLREGLEALLVVIAMIAFLRKADQPAMLPYVHGGWVAALVAGFFTWLAAVTLLDISGASREITEGVGALLAAVVLLSVGIWMHGKAQAQEWQRYIREKMSAALSRRSAWFLFGLAFVVVYREVFETILFYAALWTPEAAGVILAGALSAIAVLAVIAWTMLRYSRTLPITQFFGYSAILIAILAVVLAGKGVGALQEAGLVPVTPVPGVPRITLLGLFPTAEAMLAQLLALAAILFGFRSNRRPRPEPIVAPAE